MKNALTINFDKRQIVMTKLFAKKCTDTRSEEYAHLQSVRKDYPTFMVVTREIKKNPNKRVYKGLTYEYMRDYIILHNSPENKRKALAEFEELLLISRCQQQSYRYPAIKKWFLAKYPEIEYFGVDISEDEANKRINQLAAAS